MAWRYAEWQDGISFKDILIIILQLLSPTPCRQSENCLSWYFLASFGFGCLRKSKQQKNNTRSLEQSPKRGQTRIDAWHPSLQCTQFHLKLLVEWTSSSSSKSNQLLQNINGFCYIFFFGQILAKNEMEKFHYIRMILHTLSISNHLVGLPNPHYFQVSWRIWLLTIPLGSQVGSITNLIQLLLSTLLQEKHFGLDFSRFKIFTILPDKTNSPQIMGSRNPE